MRVSKKPLVVIKSAWLVDSVRAVKTRMAGAFTVLRNLMPYGKEIIGKLRTGYSDYTDVTEPTGMQICKIVPIQRPTQEDVHVLFCKDGSTYKEYVYPYWVGSVKQSGNFLINDYKSFSGNCTVSANTLSVTSATSKGLNQITGYWNGRIMQDGATFAQIRIHTYTSETDTALFTFIETVSGTPFTWNDGSTFTINYNFHANTSLVPTHNNSYSNPPCVVSHDSVVRFSGGSYYAESGTSDTTNKGLIYFPYIKRTYFPSDNTNKYTFEGSYISEQRCKPFVKDDVFTSGGLTMVISGVTMLLPDKTYWIAYAPIYDGYQVGELLTFTGSDYSVSSGTWTQNYLASGSGAIRIDPRIKATIDKRITGLQIYCAVDSGDTRSTGRKSQFQFIQQIDFINTIGNANYWILDTNRFHMSGAGYFELYTMPAGDTYLTKSGYVESPTDTSYSYSGDTWINGRRFLHNVYVGSESAIDRQRIFTNPLNSNGLIQPDIFSNEQDIYRLDVEPTVGTKINGLKTIGMGELLVVKDRGVLIGRLENAPNNVPFFQWFTIDQIAGVSCINQVIDGDDGSIYFAGYDDIYRFMGGKIEKLIERDDANDWLNTYKNTVTQSNKENHLSFYLPEIGAVYFLFGIDGSSFTALQYAYYPNSGWRQLVFSSTASVTADRTFRWASKLQNGNTIVVNNAGLLKRMSWSGTSLVYTDDTVGIIPQFNTGDVIFSGDESTDTILDKFVINKTLTSSTTTGTLDVYMYFDRNSSSEVQFSGKDKTDARLELYPGLNRRLAQSIKLAYNVNNSPEYLNSGSTFQIDSIELYGRFRPRVRTGE